MTHDVGLNAESDVDPNLDDKNLWFNFERHNGRLHINCDF